MMAPAVPVRLLHAEADLEEPEDLTLVEVVAILRDLVKLEHRLERPDLRVRLVRAMATAVGVANDLVRLERARLAADLFAGGLSYPAIGELFGVTGERARQWAQEAPPTNRSTTA